jgi:hypothetical protein
VAVGDGIEVGEGDCVCVGAMVAEGFICTLVSVVGLLLGIGIFGWEDWGTAAGEVQPAMNIVIKQSISKVFFINNPIPL